MNIDYKSILGILTIVLAIISYSLYFRNIFRHKTKPHAISWLVWAVLGGATFLTQRSNGAGAGGWVTGFTACVALLIFMSSIFYGEKNITSLDWLCVVGALVCLSFWYISRHELVSIALAAATFVIGFIPTFRKSYTKPSQETLATFGLNGLKFLLAVLAIDKFSLLTSLYPVTIAVANFSFVLFALARRQQVNH